MNIIIISIVLVIGILVGMGISYLVVRDMFKEKALIDEKDAMSLWDMGDVYGDPYLFDDAKTAFDRCWENLKNK